MAGWEMSMTHFAAGFFVLLGRSSVGDLPDDRINHLAVPFKRAHQHVGKRMFICR